MGAHPHPESDFQLNLAVRPRALQRETLVQRHVGDVEETIQWQVQSPKQRFLLMFFDLDHKNLTVLVPHKMRGETLKQEIAHS